jgi:hypothetical protein
MRLVVDNSDARTNDIVDPVEQRVLVYYKTPWGAEKEWLTPSELDTYNADPDAFAARYFDLSKHEYQQWANGQGTACCGFRLKSGRFCKNILSGGFQESAQEWKRRHRVEYCAVHGGPRSTKR